jgi:hypothetical protein
MKEPRLRQQAVGNDKDRQQPDKLHDKDRHESAQQVNFREQQNKGR